MGKIEYLQRRIISADEFWYENYPISIDPLGKNAKNFYDRNLVKRLFEKWNLSGKEIKDFLEKNETLGSSSNERGKDNWRVYEAWQKIYMVAEHLLSKATNKYLESKNPKIFDTLLGCGGKNVENLILYWDSSSKGIIRLKRKSCYQESIPIPGVVIDSTSMVDLESLVVNVKNLIAQAWDFPKGKKNRGSE